MELGYWIRDEPIGWTLNKLAFSKLKQNIICSNFGIGQDFKLPFFDFEFFIGHLVAKIQQNNLWPNIFAFCHIFQQTL